LRNITEGFFYGSILENATIVVQSFSQN